VARTIASSRIWVPGHLAIVVGLVLMLGGLLAIGRSIQGGLPGALARLGAAAAVAGITVGEPTTLSRVLTIILPTVITLWLVDVNALILRRAPSLEA
jgi:hypothetical protein